ncbi:MAG: hypothetical protein AB7O78_19460, partial [Thermoleophilia bacterium]
MIDLPAIHLPLPTIPEVRPGEPPVPAGETAVPSAGVGQLVPVLVTPDAPRSPSMGTIALAEPPRGTTTALSLVTALAVSPQGTDLLAPLDLGGPPSLIGPVPFSDVSGLRAAALLRAEPSAPLHANLISLDPMHRVDPSGPATAAGPAPSTIAFGQKDATAQIAAPRLVAPGGPAPSQSLLAVLASYILPGSGPVPAGT